MPKLLRATDLNLSPVLINAERVVMIGRNPEGKTVIQTDIMSPTGLVGVLVTNSLDDLAAKLEDGPIGAAE